MNLPWQVWAGALVLVIVVGFAFQQPNIPNVAEFSQIQAAAADAATCNEDSECLKAVAAKYGYEPTVTTGNR